MVDPRRHEKMDGGAPHLKLPVYTSFNYLTQNMKIDEAISVLDAQLKTMYDSLNNKIDTYEHNNMEAKQGGLDPDEFYHVSYLNYSSLIPFEGHTPEPDNPFVTVSWANFKIVSQSLKAASGISAGGYINFVSLTSPGGSFGDYHPNPWVSFLNTPGVIISKQIADGQSNTDHHGWGNAYGNLSNIGFTLANWFFDCYAQYSYFLAVGV